MSRSIDRPEFALLRRCCQWNFAGSGDDRPDAPAGLDWPAFVELARFHRVQGLIWNALAPSAASMPQAAAEALAAEARSIASNNLAIAHECRVLLDIFRRESLPLLFVKGLTVGALAYRSPMLKMGWDIDLLIDADDLGQAAELLCDQGYLPSLPAELAQLGSWHARSKESVWSRRGRFHVELHTRLADSRRLIHGLDVHSRQQLVEVGPGLALPTLGRDELFAYLCVHGASSAWFRLKWITDLAAILSQCDAKEIERLYSSAVALGAGRTAAQALLLADRLYGSLERSGLRRELAADRTSRWLAGLALAQLESVSEPTAVPLGTWRIHLNQLAMGGGLRFAFNDLARQAAHAVSSRLGK